VEKVGVVVPTMGNRPRFLAQCLKYIERQTVQPFVTRVVDEPQTVFPTDLTYRYRTGVTDLVKWGCDLIVVFEDDDYYPKNYIERIVRAYKDSNAELIGFSESIYYHIGKRQWRLLKHEGRSSMMATAFSAEFAKRISWPTDSTVFLDLKLWGQPGRKFFIKDDGCMPVGIKHGFGKHGGSGHKETFRYDHQDDWGWLESKIGKDVCFYMQMAKDGIA
jgi:hypothetical protein